MTKGIRLPKILQRLTEVGIAIAAAIALLLPAVTVFTDVDPGTLIEFTPDEGAYSLTSDAGGSGTITNATGVVTFTKTTAMFRVLTATKILLYAAASIALLILLRGVLVTVAKDEPFARHNTNRIRAIGILIPVFAFAVQALNWTTSLIAMDSVNAQGLHIEANLSPNLTYLFIGLVVVALAEIFQYGTSLQTDADLTI